jgi:plasmid stabilization system protein ParE
MQLWQAAWNPALWHEYLRDTRADEDAETIRRNTHTGRPLGAPDFVANLESALRRRLAPHRGGRPARQQNDAKQRTLGFGQI